MKMLIIIRKFPKKPTAFQEILRLSIHKTKTGAKKLTICKCELCSHLFWGKKVFKQIGIKLFCRSCYYKTTGVVLPEYIRDLTNYEKSLITQYYKETGVTVIKPQLTPL